MNARFYIGPMSKNVVDSIISFSNSTNIPFGLIPSRRQVDYNGGYANKWKTTTLCDYVKSRSKNITLQRDHGGPFQGALPDDGYESLTVDCQNFDSIHIDPWKKCQTVNDGCELTAKYISFCHSLNPNIKYEIGTEQSIFPYSAEDMDILISYLKKHLSTTAYNSIFIVVIQSGTSLKENINTGNYDQSKLVDMVTVCKKHELLSKEHNGDYLPINLINEKFSRGLDAINIAPEFGQIESQAYLDEIRNSNLFDAYFHICYNSKQWVKWVDKNFNPFENKEKIINISGHYVLSDPIFLEKIKSNVNIDWIIKNKIESALKKLCCN